MESRITVFKARSSCVMLDHKFMDHGNIWAAFMCHALILLKSRVMRNPFTTLLIIWL